MDHSPEPWVVDANGDVLACDGTMVVWSHPDDDAWHRCDERCVKAHVLEQANARRIAACVNACRGLKQEWLERVVYRHISDPYQSTLDDAKRTMQLALGPRPDQLRDMAVLLAENGFDVRVQGESNGKTDV